MLLRGDDRRLAMVSMPLSGWEFAAFDTQGLTKPTNPRPNCLPGFEKTHGRRNVGSTKVGMRAILNFHDGP